MPFPKIDKFLLGLIAAMSLHAFDDVAIITMLPAVTRQLGGESWFGASFFAYLLTSLVSLVWAGHVTDRHGPRFPFVLGLMVFIAGLMVGALASSMPVFVLGRALQGFGGGCIQSVVFSSINMAYDEKDRKRAISLLASAWILPALLAPMISGYVTEKWDWHWVFLGMIPLALLVLFITQHHLKTLTRNTSAAQASSSKADIQADLMFNTLRIAVGIGIFLASLNWMADYWPMFLLLPVGLWVFAKPLLAVFPKGILRAKPGLSAALVLKCLLVYACIGSEAFLPAYLFNVFGYTPFQAGSVVTSGAATWILATWLYEVKGAHYATRTLLTLATGILASGLLLVLLVLAVIKIPLLIYPAWAFVCFGMGLAYTIAIDKAMTHTEQGSEGATATGAGMVDAIGFSFASGFGGAILNITTSHHWPMEQAIQLIWVINAAVAVFAIYISASRFK